MLPVGGVFEVTVSWALLLVALAKLLVTTARNSAPLSDGCAFESV